MSQMLSLKRQPWNLAAVNVVAEAVSWDSGKECAFQVYKAEAYVGLTRLQFCLLQIEQLNVS